MWCRRCVFVVKPETNVNKNWDKTTDSPPTSSTPSNNMSLVKFDICPVKEDKLPPTCPRDWPRPEPRPPSHDDILGWIRMNNQPNKQTKTKRGRRGRGGPISLASSRAEPQFFTHWSQLGTLNPQRCSRYLNPPETFQNRATPEVDKSSFSGD